MGQVGRREGKERKQTMKSRSAGSLTEEQAIEALQNLAAKWPKSLGLFSWSGVLTVIRLKNGQWPQMGQYHDNIVTHIGGIQNDGGDPD